LFILVVVCAIVSALDRVGVSSALQEHITSSGGVENVGAHSCDPHTEDGDGATCVASTGSSLNQLRLHQSRGQIADQMLSQKRAPECTALAASSSAYRFRVFWWSRPKASALRAKAHLEAAGYRCIKEFVKRNWRDVDYVGLWSSDTECIMNFKGSESVSDFANNFNSKTVNAWGIPGVHAGLHTELKGLLELMDFALIRRTCKGKSLTITGHSLGGGLAQLFALLLNKRGDPLGAGIHADWLYTFGAMAVGTTTLTNDATKNGSIQAVSSGAQKRLIAATLQWMLPKIH